MSTNITCNGREGWNQHKSHTHSQSLTHMKIHMCPCVYTCLPNYIGQLRFFIIGGLKLIVYIHMYYPHTHSTHRIQYQCDSTSQTGYTHTTYYKLRIPQQRDTLKSGQTQEDTNTLKHTVYRHLLCQQIVHRTFCTSTCTTHTSKQDMHDSTHDT